MGRAIAHFFLPRVRSLAILERLGVELPLLIFTYLYVEECECDSKNGNVFCTITFLQNLESMRTKWLVYRVRWESDSPVQTMCFIQSLQLRVSSWTYQPTAAYCFHQRQNPHKGPLILRQKTGIVVDIWFWFKSYKFSCCCVDAELEQIIVVLQF